MISIINFSENEECGKIKRMDWDYWLKFKPVKFLVRLYEKAFHDDIFSRAAQVAFYFSFSIFPLLLFSVTLFGMILDSADNLRLELFEYLERIMPSSAYHLVENTLLEVVQNSSGGKLTLGFLIAIWSASSGIDSLRAALNYVYDLKENRSWWKTKTLSYGMTLGLGILFLVSLSIMFYGSHLLTLGLSSLSLPIPSEGLLDVLKLLIIFLVLIFVFEILYNDLPCHLSKPRDWITSGGVVAIILWLSFSYAFKFYLQFFDTYARTYGSLGAMIVLMLWLYLMALVILIGGAINAILLEMKKENSNADKPNADS
jgi:membrane protein